MSEEVKKEENVTETALPKAEEVTNEVQEVNQPVVAPVYEEVQVVQQEREIRTDSYFDGKVLDLIGWKILSYLITVVSATIAGPWGECMVTSYIVNHTVLNGKRLKFEGNGGDLFVQKLKWLFFTIITLGIYGFWIPRNKLRWQLSHIHFEDEQLLAEECFFDGKVLPLVGIEWLCNFLTGVSFGILYPFTVCFKLKWIAKHSIINRKKIVFDGTAINLFGHYLLWLFLTIITFGIYGFWLDVKIMQWKVKNSHIKVAGEEDKSDKSILWLILIAVVLLVVAIVVVTNIAANSSFGSEDSGIIESIEDLFNGFDRSSSVKVNIPSEY